MKEYLIKKGDGSYFNQMAFDREAREPHAKDWIKIPEGADFATSRGEVVVFWGVDGERIPKTHRFDIRVKDAVVRLGATIVWQRHPAAAVDNISHPQIIQETLKQRASTYGSFEDVARTTEVIMEELGRVRVNGLSELPYPHRMALYMIASKMSRIVNGDFNHKDSWHDIGGYAKLVEDLIDD